MQSPKTKLTIHDIKWNNHQCIQKQISTRVPAGSKRKSLAFMSKQTGQKWSPSYKPWNEKARKQLKELGEEEMQEKIVHLKHLPDLVENVDANQTMKQTRQNRFLQNNFPKKFDRNISAKYHQKIDLLKQLKPLTISQKLVNLNQLKLHQLQDLNPQKLNFRLQHRKQTILPPSLQRYHFPRQKQRPVLPQQLKTQSFQTKAFHSLPSKKQQQKHYRFRALKSLQLQRNDKSKSTAPVYSKQLVQDPQKIDAWQLDLGHSRYLQFYS